MNPNFVVPAEYFYALGSQLPPEVSADTRYQMACFQAEKQVLAQLRAAVERGIASAAAAPLGGGQSVTPEQGARRLRSLGRVKGLPSCNVPASPNDDLHALIASWLEFANVAPREEPADDVRPFWEGLSAAFQRGHLRLVLSALTQEPDSRPLIDAVKAVLQAPRSLETVQDLIAVTAGDWTQVFTNAPALLPAFTKPGTLDERIRAFLRRVARFFDVTVTGDTFTPTPDDAPPGFGLLPGDPLQLFFAHSGYALGQPIDANAFQQAAAQVFPDDRRAQAWLVQTVTTLAELFEVTEGFGALQFSLMEALYARGFTGKGSIAGMNREDFVDALTGTIAREHASAIWERAGGTQGSAPGEPSGGRPVNDGSLVNRVPPPHLSPLGPVAYLSELLKLSAASTCAEPTPKAQPTLAAALEARRGPLGQLRVTHANAQTPLPLLDRVNECLEAIAANAPGDAAGPVYDTAPLELNGHALQNPATGTPGVTAHDPATLFAALPEHSSPATPVGRPVGYEKLRSDFSAPVLPYSQPLDVCRSSLQELRSSRYAVMRRFRSSITEFVLDPKNEPSDFRPYLWRYPVRWEIAREYIGVAPEEEAIFTRDIADADVPALFGFSPDDAQWLSKIVSLPVFLAKTGLSYRELVELIASGWVNIEVYNHRGRRERARLVLPEREPGCLDDYSLSIDEPLGLLNALKRLAVFIRLWRKLQATKGAKYSFAELSDIAEVFALFAPDGAINPDFARQLVAFQLLRDHFSLALVEPHGHGAGNAASGADRLHLLALWVGPTAAKWSWAVGHLLWKIRHYAQARFACNARPPEFLKLLTENLTPLSSLAGFDPADPVATWHARPTHTLRFAEVLAKIYASSFGVGELLFLFTAGEHLNGDDPFPLASRNETLDSPLDLPDDDLSNSLWELRRKLRTVDVSDDDAASWTWARIDASLREEFGFEPPVAGADPLTSFAQHFFPTTLERQGTIVGALERQYRVPLDATAPLMWNTPPHGPFRYDTTKKELWTELPLADEAVLKKLSRVKPLSSAEQQAVQDLYFFPRTELARFAFLFSNWLEADERLIQEPDDEARWRYFQRAFALTHARCRALAEHLSAHVAQATGTANAEGWGLAWTLLKRLFADENRGKTAWEADNGESPKVTWAPPSGGAFAALLGLLGTGLRGELRASDSADADWLELRGPMAAFGVVRNDWNAPIPTVLPAMNLTLSPDELKFVGVRNGFALQGDDAERLGGAQGFSATWRGVLLVENAGSYSFYGGAPTPEGDAPALDGAEGRRWRVTLTQGQKSWVVLNHNGRGKDAHSACATPLSLKRGTYDIVVEFVQDAPAFDRPDAKPTKAGFQLKYAGPDTEGQLTVVPSERLFIAMKDGPFVLDEKQQGKAKQFLELVYFSTLRDVRRTYQRAFKALLFSHRLALSAKPVADSGQSEIGYLLDHAEGFEGLTFFRGGSGYGPHRARFDFNLLPVGDSYHAPSAAQDQRAAPSSRRQQALFDWWERLFDYTSLRQHVHHASEAPVWLAFHEAAESHPDDPAHLLRHLGVPLAHAGLVRKFYPNDSVTSAELEDERWAIRVWQADQWLRGLVRDFACEDVGDARPDLWASDDPGKVEAQESTSGNQNLTRFVQDGYLENGDPRRYESLKRLNDGLRERARAALLAYLCALGRVTLPWNEVADAPKDLSELLLLDVECGAGEQASRIEEAITAVQTFVQRARLGLEPGWALGSEFVLLWERHFASFRVWQAYKRRELYQENTIAWDELEKARASEAFRLLEEKLQSSTLTVATPAGLSLWNGERPPTSSPLQPLQAREPSTLAALAPPREGLSILGTPERHARPSWLASAGVSVSAPTVNGKLPYWIEAAVRLGARFVRVAAAGPPLGAATFQALDADADGCCVDRQQAHPPVVDEYYFWIVDSRRYDAVLQDANIVVPGVDPNEGGPWHNQESLPKLLCWKDAPMVHLFWARVHDGELKQMRRSAEGVRVAPGDVKPDLTFAGRVGDSLRFEVVGGVAPPGCEPTPNPGFRYDLPTDSAVVLPPVVATVAPPEPAFDVLPAFPYFLFFQPGAPLVPPTSFSTHVAVATALRAHRRFEAALTWYEAVFDPLNENAAWCRGEPAQPPPEGGDGQADAMGACCQGGAASADVARNRAITLDYAETLLDWGDTLVRQHSPEAFQQARLIFDTNAKLLGPMPRTVLEVDDEPVPTDVENFVPSAAPLNPRLLALYERVDDRLAMVRACVNGRRLRNGTPTVDMPYFGRAEARDGWQTASALCAGDADEGPCVFPYRFGFLVQKSLELAGEVRSLGGLLLAAYEKGDAEYLASLRAGHERQLLTLALDVRQNQWREADWQVQALKKTKEMAQTRLAYYKLLIELGLNAGEVAYEALIRVSMATRIAATVVDTVAQAIALVPDLFSGVAGIGGSPLFYAQPPVGTKLSGSMAIASRILSCVADVSSTDASLNLTQAGFVRREDEWHHQVDVITIELEQIERQILAAERRRDIALRELNNHQRQLEHSIEVQDYLRDKFTAHELYLFLQKETSALYYQMYELALHTARRAQRAFNLERGHTAKNFLQAELWDNLHEGMLAGERLDLALRAMEKEYLSLNCREYELAKHVSLRQLFPLELLQLKATGHCEIELPEWLFDLDYPGHYMRRIKSVSLTIPAVAGPFAGVHCRLTLLSSQTRIDPRLSGPAKQPQAPPNGYPALPEDARIVKQYGAAEAIATSSGQNDTGLFELNFRDERYLPFEYAGAVSRWRIELPPENNYFDLATVTDVVMHLNYTAREGGEALRRAAAEIAASRLPDAGRRLVDVKTEFPDVWHKFMGRAATKGARELELPLARDLFLFLPGQPNLDVTRLELLFEVASGTAEDSPGEPSGQPAELPVELTLPARGGRKDDGCLQPTQIVPCMTSAEWPGLYHGSVPLSLGPVTTSEKPLCVRLKFPKEGDSLQNLFVLVEYRNHVGESRRPHGKL